MDFLMILKMSTIVLVLLKGQSYLTEGKSCTITVQSFSNQDAHDGYVSFNNGTNHIILQPGQFSGLYNLNVSIYFALAMFPNCTIYDEASFFLPPLNFSNPTSLDLSNADNLTEFIVNAINVAQNVQSYVAISSFNCRGPIEDLNESTTTNKVILDNTLLQYRLNYSHDMLNLNNQGSFYGDSNSPDDKCDTWTFFIDTMDSTNNKNYIIQNGHGPIPVNFTFSIPDLCSNSSIHGCSDICHNVLRSYECACPSGFHLLVDNKTCQETDECLVYNGNCSQMCNNTVGSYNCTCYEGYELVDEYNCKDVDECMVSNGNCTDYCNNTDGTYYCYCPEGYELVGEFNCTDVDECQLQNGNCSDICTNTNGSFDCSCQTGYVLLQDMQTCEDIDECSYLNGNCSDYCNNTAGGFNCTCAEGYTLDQTELNCIDVNECLISNGNCSDICDNNNGSYSCACNTGYELQEDLHTCQDIDECSVSNCTDLCNNTGGGYECLCHDGFMLLDDKHTCTDIDECLVNNGNCSEYCNNTEGSYLCSCNTGFQLKSDNFTCEDSNECDTSNGYCSHFCNNTDGGYTCSCPDGYTIKADNRTCREMMCITQNPCLNNGTCMEVSMKIGVTPVPVLCTCQHEYTGANCETLLFCSTNPCPSNGQCNETTRTCECDVGYTGSACETALQCMLNNPCLNGASCLEQPSGASCQCPNGYSGQNCETELQCITSNPCLNGGSCVQLANGTRCDCNSGFTGNKCEQELYCVTNNTCINNGICQEGSSSAMCSCMSNYTGQNCETELFCEPSPCLNGGTCTEGQGRAICNCRSNFMGSVCETELFCDSTTCQNNGSCVESKSDYLCNCTEGYTGNTCQQKLYCVLENHCKNNSTCSEGQGAAVCQCKDGFVGASCGTEQLCITTNPCKNGGNCSENVNGTTCECPSDTTGQNCETRLYCEPNNPCQNGGECVEGTGTATCVYCSPVNPCENGGTCTEGGTSALCACPTGFVGMRCQFDIDECVMNTHFCPNNDLCANTPGSYHCTCLPGYAIQADGRTCKDDDECRRGNGGCSDICSNNQGSFACYCQDGYSLAGDKATCVDTDECNMKKCSQLCTNSVGSYNCSCGIGYILNSDNHTCGDIDECSEVLGKSCAHNCVNEVPGFSCTCNGGYALAEDGKTCGVALAVTSIGPTFGPTDGGTQVTVTVDLTAVVNISAVFLYPLINKGKGIAKEDNSSLWCSVIYWNPSSLVFTTPKVNESFAGTKLSVMVEYVTSLNEIITGNISAVFTYKPNPVITEIFPRKSFIGGGISITAFGMHLDSVANPVMIITVEQRVLDTTSSDYSVLNMHKFKSENTSVYNSTSIVGLTPNLTSLLTIVPTRKKRGTDGSSINSPTVQIFIGYELDGSERYQNLSQALSSDNGELRVFHDPQVNKFDNALYSYDPQKDTHIDIKGKRLLAGSTIVDFRVKIGNDSCTIQHVLDNVVACKPPDKEPESIDGKPKIELWIGYNGFNVGYIDYVTDQSVLLYSTIAAAIFIFLVIIIVSSCVVYAKYSNRRYTSDHMKNYVASPHDYLHPTRNGYLDPRNWEHGGRKRPVTFDSKLHYMDEKYLSYRA